MATSDHSENEAGEIKSPAYASDDESDSDLTDSENEDDALDIKPPQAHVPPPQRDSRDKERRKVLGSHKRDRDRGGGGTHQRLASSGSSRGRIDRTERPRESNRGRDDDRWLMDRGRGGGSSGGSGGEMRGKEYNRTRDDFRRDPRDVRDSRDPRDPRDYDRLDNERERDRERRALEQKRIELEREVIQKDREVTSWRQQMAERLQSAAASNRALSSASGPPRIDRGGRKTERDHRGDLRRELDRVREERSSSGGRERESNRVRLSDGKRTRYEEEPARMREKRERSRSPMRPARTVEYVDEEFPIEKGPMTPPHPPPVAPAPRTPEGTPPRDDDDDENVHEHELSLSPGHSFIDEDEREQHALNRRESPRDDFDRDRQLEHLYSSQNEDEILPLEKKKYPLEDTGSDSSSDESAPVSRHKEKKKSSSKTKQITPTPSPRLEEAKKDERRDRHHKTHKKEKKEKKKKRNLSPIKPPSTPGTPVESLPSDVEEKKRKKKKKAEDTEPEPVVEQKSEPENVDPPLKLEEGLRGEVADVMDETPPASPPPVLLPPYYPAIQGCRNVDEFKCLNRIEEGTFGVVYRALDQKNEEIVALKRLKMEKEKEGFPITSLREINTLLKAQHMNIVTVREIVVGSNMDKIYIVMDYVEHDLKSLMETMKQPFLVGEVKTLMIQLCKAINHLHDNWILHRDLKTSNLLLSHKGILKVGDFGLAREYGSPLKPYTPIVVTLWYRCPELLLGAKQYSTEIDMWSVGCIFGELLLMKPIFPGRSEIDQLNRIFKDLGTPSEKIWPKYGELPGVKKMSFAQHPYNTLRNRFGADRLSDNGFDLMNRFLTYDPTKRFTAIEALKHAYMKESPKPIDPSMFPTWPAKSEIASSKAKGAAVAPGPTAESSPKPPSGGQQFKALADAIDDNLGGKDLGFAITTAKSGAAKQGLGFTLKF